MNWMTCPNCLNVLNSFDSLWLCMMLHFCVEIPFWFFCQMTGWVKFQSLLLHVYRPTCSWGLGYCEISMVKSMSVIKDFQTWNVIGWQPIRSHVRKPLLTHGGRDKMAAIFLTTLSNEFLWMKMQEFRLKFYCSLFLTFQLTIFQHCFR